MLGDEGHSLPVPDTEPAPDSDADFNDSVFARKAALRRDLYELYSQVTEAILRAERLFGQEPAASMAYHQVSLLECKIAELLSDHFIDFSTAENTWSMYEERATARWGAVSAALTSNRPTRAIELADLYLGQVITDRLRSELQNLRDRAEESC